MPLRFLVKTAITVVTPPVVFNSFPLPATHLTAVESPRDRRSVASLHVRDCTAVVLRRLGGDEGATAGARGDGGVTAVLVRCHGGHGGAAATPLRIGPTRGGTAEVLNMLKVSAVPPRRSAVLTVFGGATAINDGTTAEPQRSWRCHCGLCRTITAVAPGLPCDGGITWSKHVDNIVSKAGKRVYMLYELNRAGISQNDLVKIYVSVIRPVLEYARPVWSTSLPNYLSDAIERSKNVY